MARSVGILDFGGGVFQMSVWFGWLVQLVLQIITQPSSFPGGMVAPIAPTVAAFAFGLNLMPAYLDSKASSMPEDVMTSRYYGRGGAMEQEATEQAQEQQQGQEGGDEEVGTKEGPSTLDM